MKRYELRQGDVSNTAFEVYSNSTFSIWTDGETYYMTDGNRYSERDVSASGTLEDIAEVLESYAEEESDGDDICIDQIKYEED